LTRLEFGSKMAPFSVVEAIMPVNLSIKGVPDDLADRLRARAERHHRSLQGELMAIVEQAALAESRGAFPADTVVAPSGSLGQGWKTIEELMAERRQRPLAATPGLPLAVDIVRADRDSR
jgi:plasmid stability protein